MKKKFKKSWTEFRKFWPNQVIEIHTQKSVWEDLTTFFMSTWWGDSKNVEEIEFSRWLFEGRLRQDKNVLPDVLNWLCYFADRSKSLWEFNFFHIFGISSSSRHEKRCQIFQTLFWVLQYSRNSAIIMVLKHCSFRRE